VVDEPRRAVDYRKAADRYDLGRSVGAALLDRWWSAIARHLPNGPRAPMVADIGAGTGIFTEEWIRRGASRVVAIEPTDAMRARAGRRAGGVENLDVVAARAEQLPLTDASVDVAWMSAVVHHFTDLPAAADEARRVLRPEGLLFVRGYFPDRSAVPWLDFFEGADQAR
jgi:ubiquinone/menaquinone biosynthesis C-methylase UbiE